jgi:DNA-directed RNA polymerase specialized sigma24 family protein
LSTEEASEVVGVSVPAFKARLHHGREALREALNSYVVGLRK